MELDAKFIEKLYKKDEEALGVFLGEFKVPLYNYIYRIIYNRHDAEDILQEVFLKIFRNIFKIDFSKNYKSFIYKIARNATLDFLKKRKEEYKFNKKPIEKDEESCEKLEIKNTIEIALRSLNTKERELIVLKYIQGFKISEISEILKIPESTIKIRTFRIIRKMRNYMQDK
ncbi:RNA polymerase sigma factor [bacterium]|nr:RNA polymerase sigma factor [bacterium]